MQPLNYTTREPLFKKLLELIELLDSFDQLTKLAVICDLLYIPTDYEHKHLFAAAEKSARRLRGLPILVN